MMKRRVKLDEELMNLVRDAYIIDMAIAGVVIERIIREEEMTISGPENKTDIQTVINSLRDAIKRLQSIDEVRRARLETEDDYDKE